MGNSPSEISEKTGMQSSDVQTLLATIQATYSMEMYELSSQLLMLNLGRAEMLIKAVMPAAITGDLRAIKAFTDLAKLEIEWHKQVLPPSHEGDKEDDAGTVVVERYEQTLTSRNNLYDIALNHINDEWVSNTSIELDDIYSNTPTPSQGQGVWAGTPEPADIRLAKIAEVVDKLSKIEATPDDETDR